MIPTLKLSVEADRARVESLLIKLKLNPAVADARDATAANVFPGRDIKLLPHPAAKHLRKVLSMSADQSGASAGDFVGNPAAPGHADLAPMIIVTIPVIQSEVRPLAGERTFGVEGPDELSQARV